MVGARTFGKLGNRAIARLETAIDGGLVLTGRSEQCRVENVSRLGCRLHLDAPPRLGATLLVRIDRIETLGTVAWVRSGRCGVKFARPLEQGELERLRWSVEHADVHEHNRITYAIATMR